MGGVTPLERRRDTASTSVPRIYAKNLASRLSLQKGTKTATGVGPRNLAKNLAGVSPFKKGNKTRCNRAVDEVYETWPGAQVQLEEQSCRDDAYDLCPTNGDYPRSGAKRQQAVLACLSLWDGVRPEGHPGARGGHPQGYPPPHQHRLLLRLRSPASTRRC